MRAIALGLLNLPQLQGSHIFFVQNLPNFDTSLKPECNRRQAPNLTVITHSQISNLKSYNLAVKSISG
jgi:hypothetical protein